MILNRIDLDFLKYLLQDGHKPGERLPSLNEISTETGMSMGKLREQFEVARTLGLVDASPRRGIVRTEYDFLPAVRLSLMVALAIDPRNFEAFSSLRGHLETAYWDEAVQLLTDADKVQLCALVASAWEKLRQMRIQIPFQEHRELHLTIFRRVNNPFVVGLLEAYWDAYEAVELNTFADLGYLQSVWRYHERIVNAIECGRYDEGKRLLIEHMQLLSARGAPMELPGADSGGVAVSVGPANGAAADQTEDSVQS
jgi:DNA-binding FadR family transcriptional regulator